MKLTLKMKHIIIFLIIPILIISSLSWYFFTLSDRKAIVQTKNYVQNWSYGQSIETFTQQLKSMGTDTFIEERLDSEVKAYQSRIDSGNKDTNKVIKTILIDKHPTAIEAVTYYLEHNSDKNYDVPMQANIILFKENETWKIQNVYILNRSDQPISNTAQAEEQAQSSRYTLFSELVDKEFNAINNQDINSYLSLFSNNVDKEKPQTDFKNLMDHKVKLQATGVYNLSSSDREAYVMVVALKRIDNKPQNTVINLKLVFEEGNWKIDKIELPKEG